MKNEVKRKHYSLSEIILLSMVGSIFVIVGISTLIEIVISIIRAKDIDIGVSIVVPILCFGLLPIALGTIALILGIKQIYGCIREKKAKNSNLETTAKIIDYKMVSHRGNLNKRFSLVLSYEFNGEQKVFTTDYLFDINEFRYLQTLHHIKIKVDGNYVVVAEPFSEDIYKINPRYEIETAFFKQPAVKKLIYVWRIFIVITILLCIVSIILTTTLHNSLYLLTFLVLFNVIHMPFGILIAIYLIKWLKKKN